MTPMQATLDWAVRTGRIREGERATWVGRLTTASDLVHHSVRQLKAIPAGRHAAVDAATAAEECPWDRPAAAVAQTPAPRPPNQRVDAGPRPTLFPTGDLPPVTACGVDPQALLKVPWQARPLLARAATTQEFYALYQRYSTPQSAEYVAFDPVLLNDIAAYERRLRDWELAQLSDAQFAERVLAERSARGSLRDFSR